MGKIKVHELAKELGMQSKELVDKLINMQYDVKNHMSSLDDSDAEKQPDHKIIEADNQTSEQNPKYVSQEPHSKQFLFRRSETG